MSELNISAVGSKGGDSTFQKGTTRGQRQEHGIVLGIVKSNSHPSRSGILNVFVPEFGTTGVSGGKKLEEDSSQWRQVQYATPFYSRTETIGDSNSSLSVKNTAGFVYGGATKPVIRQSIQGSGRAMLLRFVTTASANPFSIFGFSIQYEEAGLR